MSEEGDGSADQRLIRTRPRVDLFDVEALDVPGAHMSEFEASLLSKKTKYLDGPKLPGQASSARCGHTVTSGGLYVSASLKALIFGYVACLLRFIVPSDCLRSLVLKL